MIRVDTRLAPRVRLHPLAWLKHRVALSRQRRDLAALDDTALHDIGVTRDAAETEAKRPFWDAPDNWRI